jgi:hypothetical protein
LNKLLHSSIAPVGEIQCMARVGGVRGGAPDRRTPRWPWRAAPLGGCCHERGQRARFSAATLTSWPDICRTWRENASHWGVGDGALNTGARPAGRAVLNRLVSDTRNADTRPGARQQSVLALATSASFNFDAWLPAWDPRTGATCRRRSMRFE